MAQDTIIASVNDDVPKTKNKKQTETHTTTATKQTLNT